MEYQTCGQLTRTPPRHSCPKPLYCCSQRLNSTSSQDSVKEHRFGVFSHSTRVPKLSYFLCRFFFCSPQTLCQISSWTALNRNTNPCLWIKPKDPTGVHDSSASPYLFLGTGMWEEGRGCPAAGGGTIRPCAALKLLASSASFPGFLMSKCMKPPCNCPFMPGQWVGLALFKIPEEPVSFWSPWPV